MMTAPKLIEEWLSLDAASRARMLSEDPKFADEVAQHIRSLMPTTPAPEPTTGKIVVPLCFIGPSSASKPTVFEEISTSEIVALEYARIGTRTGTWIFIKHVGAERAVIAAIEPGAVLMRIFHASPDDAKRLDACAKKDGAAK